MLSREQVEEAARLFLHIYQAEIDTEGWSDEFVTSLLTKFAEEFYTRTDAAKVQRELNDVRADAQQLVRTNQDLRAEVEGLKQDKKDLLWSLNDKCEFLGGQIMTLTAQLAAMTRERDEACAEIDTLQARMTALEEALKGVLLYTDAEECQECGIGKQPLWKQAQLALAHGQKEAPPCRP